GDGTVELLGVVTDPTAMTKISERTYTGVLVSFDGDVIADISLIDSPAAFMEKVGRPARSHVIAKIYDGGDDVKDWKRAKKMAKCNGGTRAEYYAALKKVRKAVSPVLSPSAQVAVNELSRTEAVLKSGGGGDRLAAQAQNARAQTQCNIEMIKAI